MVLNFFKNLRKKLTRIGDGKKNDASPTIPTPPLKPKGRLSGAEQPEPIQATPKKPSSPHRKRPVKRRRKRPNKTGGPPNKIDNDSPPLVKWHIDDFQVPLADGKLRFHDLDLRPEIMHAIHDLGFQYCTPIQAEILPSTLAGKDASGRAQTGTGKTAAFLISIFTTLMHHPASKTGKWSPGSPRTLILAPTRELVMQIVKEAQNLSKYCPIRTIGVYGGIDYEKQQRELKAKKLDILVATPGRLLDFQRRKVIRLDTVEILVIDEADRMLDMGFIPDVRKIVYSTPAKKNRQTLLFSATLTEEVSRLAMQWTKDPVKVEIEPEKVAVDSVNQIVYIVTTDEKMALLYNIITLQNLERVIVFCNRRDETRHLTELLRNYRVNCAMISGEILQKKRIRALEDFRSGKIRVLVATDVAGRGLHIEGISHVINYTLPHDPEDYVHRIGRTGRAGATGTSISFACEEDSFHLPDIETLLGQKLPCIYPDDKWLILPPMPAGAKKKPQDTRRRQRPARRRKPSRRTAPHDGRKRKPAPRPATDK